MGLPSCSPFDAGLPTISRGGWEMPLPPSRSGWTFTAPRSTERPASADRSERRLLGIAGRRFLATAGAGLLAFKSAALAVATQSLGRERLSALQFAAAFGLAALAPLVFGRSATDPGTILSMEDRP